MSKNFSAFNALRAIEKKDPNIALRVLTVDDVLTTNNWPDTPANRRHIVDSWEWEHWSDMREEDWEMLAFMDDAPDTYEKGYKDG